MKYFEGVLTEKQLTELKKLKKEHRPPCGCKKMPPKGCPCQNADK